MIPMSSSRPEARTHSRLIRRVDQFELLLDRSRRRHGSSPQGKRKTVEELPSYRLYESAARHVVARASSVIGVSEMS